MSRFTELYRPSLSLLTDLYQLTMAYGYWRSGVADLEATFNLHFRSHPFGSGFTIACGLGDVVEAVDGFRFQTADLDYLAGLLGNDGRPLFAAPFLSYLGGLRLSCDLDGVPEGTVVFPYEPLLRVTGPIIEGQLLETLLLNLVNFQTLIATKAARVCLAARGDRVLEFGLRRAHGVDGAVTAARAAYVGGCHATSDVLAGRLLGIPVAGTHAHSWVMAFPSELEAFQAYARAMPNNCVFLVDTYSTLDGVRNAVEVGRWLESQGHRLGGVRLDSGDLAYLSVEARRILDEGGFPDADVFASNDLDEHLITSLKEQGAQISVWGVGTRLVTGHDQSALGGVYKLSAVRRPGEAWQYKLKVSEQAAKVTTPGVLQVRRFRAQDGFAADMIYDQERGIDSPPTIVDPHDLTRRKRLDPGAGSEDLLLPVLRGGRRVYEVPALAASRQRTSDQLADFHPGVKRLVYPHQYPVGIEKGLSDLKVRLILEARGYENEAATGGGG